jgi:HD-GYP domain-containing protein (c-di-GMP phosphodiesterase class II)
VQKAKGFVARNFEPIVVIVLVVATAFAVLVAADKYAILNFFYIPALTAAYFLGVRQGVLVSVAAVLMITVYAIINPEVFTSSSPQSPGVALFLWGAFLIVTSYVVGSLYEAKARGVAELKHAYDGILGLVATLIDAVDKHAEDHSVRVAALAARIGVVLDMPTDEIETVHVAGLLHEMSKVDVSLGALRKAAASEPDSRGEDAGMQSMSSAGGRLSDVVYLVERYQERFDGSGPIRLKGGEIPRGARVLAVADAYESFIAPRPYGQGLVSAESLAEVEKESGSRYDPAIVQALIIAVEAE